MRKVSLFMQSFDEGGVQTVMINLANGLVGANNVDFVIADAKGPMISRVKKNIKIHNFKKVKFSGDYKVMLSLFKFISYIRKEKPDVMIASPGFCSVIAILAKIITLRELRVIIIIDDKLSVMKKAKIKNRISFYLYKIFFKYADDVVVAHKNATIDLLNNFNLSKDKVHTIYHPLVNLNTVKSTQPKYEILSNFASQNDQIIVTIGRLFWAKDQINIIDALHLASQKNNKLKLIIVGTGPDLEFIEARIKKHDLVDRVMMYGFADNQYEILKLGDLFVLPSKSEAFGIVIVEALACGLTVVATDCLSGGPREILNNGKYGYLCPTEDSKALSEAIIKGLKSPILPKLAISRAKDFSVEKSVYAYQKLIDKVNLHE